MAIKGTSRKATSLIDHSPSTTIFRNRRNGRRIVFLLFCLSLIFTIAALTLVSIAGADPSDDIDARESEAEAVREDIAVLNADLELKVEKYNYANYQLDEIESSIAANEQKLEETRLVLDDTQERLDQRVVNIYKSGSTDMLDVLMETTDISDFLTKFDMLTKVGEQDRDDVEQVKMLKQQIEDAQTQLAEDQVRQTELVGQLEAEKAEIEAGLAEREAMLAGIEDEIAALQEQEAAAQAQLEAEVVASMSGYGGGGGGFSAPTITNTGDAVGIAMQYLGVPYVWGGESASGVDCSGLVKVVYAQLGYSLPHSAAAQMGYGTPVSYDQLMPGDLVFFGYGYIGHVGIYIGGGNMIHAPFEGQVVSIAPVSYGGSYAGATRL